MPAIVSHWLLGKRVLPLLKQREDITQLNETCFLWGCQGPDVLFFQRLLPWLGGHDIRAFGGKIHDGSPSKFFAAVIELLDMTTGTQHINILSYALGVCCHYCFDCAAHPFINWLQKQMTKEDPRGAEFNYHGEIESMLDVMLLRHDTGRLLMDMKLTECLPEGDDINEVLSFVWKGVLLKMYGFRMKEKNARVLYSDTLNCFRVLDNRSLVRLPLIKAAERLVGNKGGSVSSFMRPLTESLRWDYGNMNHGRWVNTMDEEQTGTEDIYQIADRAEKSCHEMFEVFMRILRRPEGETAAGGRAARVLQEFIEYTGERSFSYNARAVNC